MCTGSIDLQPRLLNCDWCNRALLMLQQLLTKLKDRHLTDCCYNLQSMFQKSLGKNFFVIMAYFVPIVLVSTVFSNARKSIPRTNNGSLYCDICCSFGRGGKCRNPSHPAVHSGVLFGRPESKLFSRHQFQSNSESNSLSSLEQPVIICFIAVVNG